MSDASHRTDLASLTLFSGALETLSFPQFHLAVACSPSSASSYAGLAVYVLVLYLVLTRTRIANRNFHRPHLSPIICALPIPKLFVNIS